MKKQRITITIDSALLEWLDQKIKDRIFANRSHGIEFLIAKKKEESKNERR